MTTKDNPKAGMTLEERANHILTKMELDYRGSLDAIHFLENELRAAVDQAKREALEEAAKVVEKAFENSWVVQDTLDAIRALKDKT